LTLLPGISLGPYRIEAPLGQGGMGEVYEARDTRLDRTVAIKVLPEHIAGDLESKQRFEREARAVAALNHPNICHLYDIGSEESSAGPGRRIDYLVLEYLDGETLAQRLERGALPLDEALRIAIEIADAIDKAHEQGIVHRDLKPGNVMLTKAGTTAQGLPHAKLLDFGLAKFREIGVAGTEALSAATTRLQPLTERGALLGTMPYMAPEQLEGKATDGRTDIFAFGAVLYEMLTGRRAFEAESAASLIGAILKDAPPSLAQEKPDLPGTLDRIIRICLAKQPTRRYQIALDIRNELEDLQDQLFSETIERAPAVVGARRIVSRWAVAIAAGLVLVAVGANILGWPPFSRDTRAPALRATFARLTSQPRSELFPSLSPNGRWLVYSGESAGRLDIFLQSVSGQTPINLTPDSPDDDEQPTFSPDGEQIAFRSSRGGGGIFVMGRTGEAVRRVTRGGFNPAWSPDGSELAYTTVPTGLRPRNAEQRGQLMVVSVDGGEPRLLLGLDVMLPSWSPSGGRIAFSGRLGVPNGGSNIGTLPAAGGDVAVVTKDSFLNWNPVWSPDGSYLYYVSDRGGSMNIWRIPVDESSGRPRGEPESVTSPASFATHLSISGDGRRLAYSAVLETQNIEKLRLDPATGEVLGEPEPVTTGSRFWANPDPSPDGQWVVFYSQVASEGDLYVAKSDGSGPLRQLTSDAAIDRVPRWSPDGSWIAMFSDRSGELQIWMIRVDGSDLQQVTKEETGGGVVAWAPDGDRLAVTLGDALGADIIDPHLAWGEQTPASLPPPPPPHPRFVPNSWSPDGKWIAGQNGYRAAGISIYSTEAQTYERLIEFGEWPVWMPDSRHILFVNGGREFLILDVPTGTPKRIFSVFRDTLGPPRPTRDGREVYFSRRVTEADVWLATLQ